jgi:hypothetical protein
MADTFVKIASVTVGSGGATTMNFTSIPSSYTDLCLKISARVDSGLTYSNAVVSFNGSTTGYSNIRLNGNGSTTSGSTITGAPYLYVGEVNGNTSTSNTFGNLEVYIPNYTSSNNKSASSDGVTENNATQAFAMLHANLWANSAAITSISIGQTHTTFLEYSTATLYGILKP